MNCHHLVVDEGILEQRRVAVAVGSEWHQIVGIEIGVGIGVEVEVEAGLEYGTVVVVVVVVVVAAVSSVALVDTFAESDAGMLHRK